MIDGELPKTVFIDGKAQFDGYECRCEMHIAQDGPHKGKLVMGWPEGSARSYWSVWVWKGEHPLKFNSKNKLTYTVHVNSSVTKYISYDKKGKQLNVKLTREDAKRIKKCLNSLYPIHKDGTMWEDYPSSLD